MHKNNLIIMQQKRHLCQDGVQYYRTLCSIYHMKLFSLKVRHWYAAFFNMAMAKSESIDSFAAPLLQEMEIINTNGKTTNKVLTPEEVRKTFIYSLPLEFTNIKQLFETNPLSLPSKWLSKDIETLIPTAKNHLKSLQRLREANKAYKDTNKEPDPKKPPRTSKTGGV